MCEYSVPLFSVNNQKLEIISELYASYFPEPMEPMEDEPTPEPTEPPMEDPIQHLLVQLIN